jgi:hypothetical protein
MAAGDPFWGRINHPDMPAAYPPVVLALFAAAGKVAYHPGSMKALAVAADLGTIAMILLLAHRGLNARYRNDPVSGLFFAFGALLLLSPTVHFWYLSWVLVFLPLRPTLSWLVLSLTAGAYFVTYGVVAQTGHWRLPEWAVAVHWLPFFVLLCGGGIRFAARMRRKAPDLSPGAVSVVIPTKNEAGPIFETVNAAQKDDAVCEVIVVDGGYTDGTRDRAAAAGARVLVHRRPPRSWRRPRRADPAGDFSGPWRGGRGGPRRHGCRPAGVFPDAGGFGAPADGCRRDPWGRFRKRAVCPSGRLLGQ